MSRYDSISRLIRQLRQKVNANIVLNDFIGWMTWDPKLEQALYPLGIHDNPYCITVKKNKARWDRCIRSKQVLWHALEGQDAPVVGQCPFGVMEIAYPVLCYGQVVGAVSMTGLQGDLDIAQARLRRAARSFGADADALQVLYLQELFIYNQTIVDAECIAETLAVLLSSLADNLRPVSRPLPSPSRQRELLVRAIEYLYNQVGVPIRAADVARFCHVSESYLQHLFIAQRGQSLSRTLCSIRMDRARSLLAESDLPVHRVAQQCGYDDPNYFSTAFRTNFGESPRAYRTRRKQSR
jgi:AraC-like DNA-binding protein/ligand-binding sensor protein